MSVFLDRASISIGADPELFIKKDGKFVSAHNYPCGDKQHPRRTDHGEVQNDGVALELNIRPAFTRGQFVLNFRGVLYDLDRIVKTWDKGEGYLVAEPVAPFAPEYLKNLPDRAKELGCNPDFNAYTSSPNDRPNGDVPFRTGAGHLHIGWAENQEGVEHFMKCADLVRQLDYTVGLRTVLFDHEPRRRMLYGKAGTFRPKPYGCEYRVPSNAWCQSEARAGDMFDSVIQAVDLLNKGRDLDKETEGLAREIIDNNKVDWPTLYPELAKVLEV